MKGRFEKKRKKPTVGSWHINCCSAKDTEPPRKLWWADSDPYLRDTPQPAWTQALCVPVCKMSYIISNDPIIVAFYCVFSCLVVGCSTRRADVMHVTLGWRLNARKRAGTEQTGGICLCHDVWSMTQCWPHVWKLPVIRSLLQFSDGTLKNFRANAAMRLLRNFNKHFFFIL